jgi:hypothetical protein
LTLFGAASLALPSARGVADPAVVLTVMALVAPAAGALCAGVLPVSGRRGLLVGTGGLLVWSIAAVVAAVFGSASLDAAGTLTGMLTVCGLAGAGYGLGSLWPERAAVVAMVLTGLCLLATAAPVGGGLWQSRVSEGNPELGALLLDLSPVSLTLEPANLDWTRHPSIYGPAGTDWFSDRRAPHGTLAALTVLVVGFSAGLAGHLVRSRPGSSR